MKQTMSTMLEFSRVAVAIICIATHITTGSTQTFKVYFPNCEVTQNNSRSWTLDTKRPMTEVEANASCKDINSLIKGMDVESSYSMVESISQNDYSADGYCGEYYEEIRKVKQMNASVGRMCAGLLDEELSRTFVVHVPILPEDTERVTIKTNYEAHPKRYNAHAMIRDFYMSSLVDVLKTNITMNANKTLMIHTFRVVGNVSHLRGSNGTRDLITIDVMCDNDDNHDTVTLVVPLYNFRCNDIVLDQRGTQRELDIDFTRKVDELTEVRAQYSKFGFCGVSLYDIWAMETFDFTSITMTGLVNKEPDGTGNIYDAFQCVSLVEMPAIETNLKVLEVKVNEEHVFNMKLTVQGLQDTNIRLTTNNERELPPGDFQLDVVTFTPVTDTQNESEDVVKDERELRIKANITQAGTYLISLYNINENTERSVTVNSGDLVGTASIEVQVKYCLDKIDCDGDNGGSCSTFNINDEEEEIFRKHNFTCDCSSHALQYSHATRTCSLERREEKDSQGLEIGLGLACGAIVLLLLILLGMFTRKRMKIAAKHTFKEEIIALYDEGIMPADGSLTEVSNIPVEIPQACITELDQLGKGAGGVIMKAVLNWREGFGNVDVHVAMKKLDKNAPNSTRDSMLAEAALMAQFDHDNIAKLIGVCTRYNACQVIMELCDHGSLLSFLKSHSISVQGTLVAMQDITSGMEYLASRRFVHRDLAARNVLLSARYVCKVADFGMSRVLKNMENDEGTDYYRMTSEDLVPIRWCSVEILEDRKYSSSSDVWAYGVTVSELFTNGSTPYGECSNMEVMSLIKKGIVLPKPERCPDIIYEQHMLSTFNHQPQKRPTFLLLADDLRHRLPDELPSGSHRLGVDEPDADDDVLTMPRDISFRPQASSRSGTMDSNAGDYIASDGSNPMYVAPDGKKPSLLYSRPSVVTPMVVVDNRGYHNPAAAKQGSEANEYVTRSEMKNAGSDLYARPSIESQSSSIASGTDDYVPRAQLNSSVDLYARPSAGSTASTDYVTISSQQHEQSLVYEPLVQRSSDGSIREPERLSSSEVLPSRRLSTQELITESVESGNVQSIFKQEENPKRGKKSGPKRFDSHTEPTRGISRIASDSEPVQSLFAYGTLPARQPSNTMQNLFTYDNIAKANGQKDTARNNESESPPHNMFAYGSLEKKQPPLRMPSDGIQVQSMFSYSSLPRESNGQVEVEEIQSETLSSSPLAGDRPIANTSARATLSRPPSKSRATVTYTPL
eukprot:m.28281 g.28281  ORF g.28281 m.28281 type:complete len:1243 (-) comp7989_c0_seq1:478-4206(-)